jgi:hypothetical protein
VRTAALTILLLPLFVLAACKSTGTPKEPAPTPGAGETGRPGAQVEAADVPEPPGRVEGRTLQIKPLQVDPNVRLSEKVREAADEAFRALLGQRFELTDEKPDIVLQPVLKQFRIREIGAGTAFTMRDLGLEPGRDFLVADVRFSGVVQLDGRTVEDGIRTQVKGGEYTPGVTMADTNGDGRVEAQMSPRAQASFLEPALIQLVNKLLGPHATTIAPTEVEEG